MKTQIIKYIYKSIILKETRSIVNLKYPILAEICHIDKNIKIINFYN